ncbi:UNVERIFIED_CONTAM: hypothetical protein FKN15_008985 [Acipenser sinensis]
MRRKTNEVLLEVTLQQQLLMHSSTPSLCETTYHTLEEGVVEYCTTEPPPATEPPMEVLTSPGEGPMKPQELKSRIALNSAKLLQEQRVTNLHVREIAQHLENQNDLLQMIRRSQEAQACAQERQAQALEGTQAALIALIQMLRPALNFTVTLYYSAFLYRLPELLSL